MRAPAESIHIPPEADPLKGFAVALPLKPEDSSQEPHKRRRQTARQREVYREGYAEGVRDGGAEAAVAREDLRSAGMLCLLVGIVVGSVGTLCMLGIARGFGWV